ncbi:hypothetical protein TSAR_012857 [Trichomalopsis sarcophagae]|uniref:Uncharacterized protein n=1 Tax=Trichomalopsis sarcophagae TaxID=543379 RepID=A0A232FBW8_9HYME|nr:hypothetical protein TSAR_012857 [Trichomalopsis sarcophagae]
MIHVQTSGGGGGAGPGLCPRSGSGNSSSSGSDKCDRLRQKSLAFLANLFKVRRRNHNCLAGMRIIDEENNSQTNETIMQRSPRLENPGLHSSSSSSNVVDEQGSGVQSRIPSTLSVTAVDVAVACRQAAAAAAANGASPSHSILTLTPGRTRNIDQDMEALRLSRQDNPYLQANTGEQGEPHRADGGIGIR